METYPPRGVSAHRCTIPSQSATGNWDWSFHTVRGGVDPGDHRFRPQVFGFVDVQTGVHGPMPSGVRNDAHQTASQPGPTAVGAGGPFLPYFEVVYYNGRPLYYS